MFFLGSIIFCVSGSTGLNLEAGIFIQLQIKKIMKEKCQVGPDEVLSKEFLCLFKKEVDLSRFLK